jgi:hypothetical protein
MTECLILLASICLHQADNIQVKDTSLGFFAIVKVDAATIEISAHSDNFSTPDWSKMSEACESGSCLAYFKHCAGGLSRESCEYHFSQPGDKQNSTIRIIAADSKGIEDVESGIGVAIRTGWQRTVVPLSRFEVESSQSTPPYCGRRKPQSACWPGEGTRSGQVVRDFATESSPRP